MKLSGFSLWAICLAAVAGESGPAWVDLPFEQLVQLEISGASKYPQPLRQAPSAAQVIEREDIRRHGWRTLAEALASLPGVYTAFDRAYDYVGDRGLLVPGDYNTRYLLLVDGQRMNDNIFEQANFGHDFQVDMALVERIEYLPGPASSIYGSNAVLGVINVITRSAHSLPSGEAALEIDSRGWRKLRLTGSQLGRGDGPDIVFSLSRGSSMGSNTTYPGAVGLTTPSGPSADGVAHGLDRVGLSRAWLSLSQGGFRLSAWAARRDEHPSSALYGSTFDDDRLRLVDASYGIALNHLALAGENWQLDSRLSFQRMTYGGDYPGLDAFSAPVLLTDRTTGAWWSGELRGLYSGWRDHKVVVGGEFSADRQARQHGTDPTAGNSEGQWQRQRRGIYLQDEWHFAPAWHAHAGLRHDSFSSGRELSSPRLGLIWQGSERFTLKLLAGRAYRWPNAYEMRFPNTATFLGNPALQPEYIRSQELVGEWQWSAQTKLAASLFRNRLDNIIQLTDIGGGLSQYRNFGHVVVHGLELSAVGRSTGGHRFAASLAISEAQSDTGDAAANSPHWVAKLRSSQPVFRDWLIGAIEIRAIGPRQTLWEGNRSRVGPQAQLNATLTASRLAPGLEIRLRAVNLSNRRSPQPASSESPLPTLPLPGRYGELVLTYAF